MKLVGLKGALLELLDEIVYNFMLEERDVAASSCNHQWKKTKLDCGIHGYYCTACRKQTLP